MPFRFVILHHLGWGAEHFDLMLEHESGLATWRIMPSPSPQTQPEPPDHRFFENVADAKIENIGDHRKTYLEFEGEVPGGRGFVRRVCTGVLVWILRGDPWLEVFIHSTSRIGTLRLTQSGSNCWTLRFTPAN